MKKVNTFKQKGWASRMANYHKNYTYGFCYGYIIIMNDHQLFTPFPYCIFAKIRFLNEIHKKKQAFLFV